MPSSTLAELGNFLTLQLINIVSIVNLRDPCPPTTTWQTVNLPLLLEAFQVYVFLYSRLSFLSLLSIHACLVNAHVPMYIYIYNLAVISPNAPCQ